MAALVALWRKEALVLSRDLHGLAVLFIMPAAFVVVMSLALSDELKGGPARGVQFAVIAPDAALAARFAERLTGDGFRPSPAPADETEARAAVRRGKPPLVLIAQGDPSDAQRIPTLRLLADPTLPSAQLLAFRQRTLGVTLGMRVAQAARDAGLPQEAASLDLEHAATLSVETVGERLIRPSSVQQSVPAWLIFGMFFVVVPMSSLFIVERRDGTLSRLASMQVPFSAILAGKLAPFFVVNTVQAALMLAAGRFIVPWLGGEALALPSRWDLLAAVAVCTSLAALGWGLAVAVYARTLEQAVVVGGVGNILIAAIGGIMVPRFVMPEAMQRLAELSPMAWALDGFHAVMLRGGDAAAIAPSCAKLLALAAVLLGAAIALQRRKGAA